MRIAAKKCSCPPCAQTDLCFRVLLWGSDGLDGAEVLLQHILELRERQLRERVLEVVRRDHSLDPCVEREEKCAIQ